MSQYQVLARKYRPQTFNEVLGQEAVVTILKNAIAQNRLAHAYLFCGPRGTGKTTLARLFAKTLNCGKRSSKGEPCNECSSCKEITGGHSLDVMEIDGASHRGIDDIRQINETVGYATSTGGYKIYIIDEVHMLTKEAFNALLKTLEEPPAKVMFFFATTEPHKVLPTILSRCQRFNLNRIPTEIIVAKLGQIAKDMKIKVEEEALRLIATRAEGGLRDAESLFDQIISYHNKSISTEDVATVLGIMPRECLFDLDKAGKEGNLSIAFDIAHRLYSEGKDLVHFVETLIDHFRTLLLIKLSGKEAPYLTLSPTDREKYAASAALYSKEQCLTIIDFLITDQQQIRFAPSGQVALEAILLRILRSHNRIPVEYLVRKLAEMESKFSDHKPTNSSLTEDPTPTAQEIPRKKAQPPPSREPVEKEGAGKPTKPAPAKESVSVEASKPKKPTPPKESAPIDLGARPTAEAAAVALKDKSKYDTLLHFAAVELEGNLQKH